MITKEQALLAFCGHCDNRMEFCGECALKEIIDSIPDMACPFCGKTNDESIQAALEEIRHE
jgi:hypothetical protein